MHSEIFILAIKNPESQNIKKYLIDYNGSKTKREIEKDVKEFIKKNKYFQSKKFSEEYLEGYSYVYYMDDLNTIEVIVPKSDWNIDLE